MFSGCSDQLLFAPKIVTAMVMQGHNPWRREFAILRDQNKGRDAQVWSGVEIDPLSSVAVFLGALDHFRARFAAGRLIMEQVQELASRSTLPRAQIFELGSEIREWELLASLALDEGKERAHV
jgi:hypothetical protein